MPLVGDLRDMKNFDLLKFLKRIEPSGILTIDSPMGHGSVTFKRGMIVSVTVPSGLLPESQNESPIEKLKSTVRHILSWEQVKFKLEPADIRHGTEALIDPEELL